MAARSFLPETFRKLVVRQISPKFRESVELVTVPMVKPGPGQVLVRSKYFGINASDINFSAGRYTPDTKPPFDCGMEGIGQVVSLGPDCRRAQVGQTVGYLQFGAFAEYLLLSEKVAVPLPGSKVEYLPLMVSGLTAAISLDKVAELKSSDVVLVTAAAGGTGQFAVQWAKHAGCHVIGVTSSPDKVKFLQSLGCDRVIDYSTEKVAAVLKVEYPKGVDVVYESVGGELFETCLRALAPKGRLIIIGYISGYEEKHGLSPLHMKTPALVTHLLTKSLGLRGFYLFNYAADWAPYMARLVGMYEEGKLKCAVDRGQGSPGGAFRGLEGVAGAVEHMYARRNVGKVVVECGGGGGEVSSKL